MKNLCFLILSISLSLFSKGMASLSPLHIKFIYRPASAYIEDPNDYLGTISRIVDPSLQDKLNEMLKSYFFNNDYGRLTAESIYKDMMYWITLFGYKDDHRAFLEYVVSQHAQSLNIFKIIAKISVFKNNLPMCLQNHPDTLRSILFVYSQINNDLTEEFLIKCNIINVMDYNYDPKKPYTHDYWHYIVLKMINEKEFFERPSHSLPYNNHEREEALLTIKNIPSLDSNIVAVLEKLNAIANFEESVKKLTETYISSHHGPELLESRQRTIREDIQLEIKELIQELSKRGYKNLQDIEAELLTIFNHFLNTIQLEFFGNNELSSDKEQICRVTIINALVDCKNIMKTLRRDIEL